MSSPRFERSAKPLPNRYNHRLARLRVRNTCRVLLGLGKGGSAGISALSLPLLAFAIDPVRAVAITLPVLMAQGIVGVWAFRRTVDWRLLGWMLHGTGVGIVLGTTPAEHNGHGRPSRLRRPWGTGAVSPRSLAALSCVRTAPNVHGHLPSAQGTIQHS